MSSPGEKMEVDGEAVVDLSVGNARREPSENGCVEPAAPAEPALAPAVSPPPPPAAAAPAATEPSSTTTHMRPPRPPKDYDDHHPRRNLRPRRERSYAESPDIIVLSDEEPRINGFTNGYESDSDDGEMPPLPIIKELSQEELAEKERMIRKLKEELRNEEMKLVLLKKLKQSQQMKENIAVMTPITQASAVTKLAPSVTLSAKLSPPIQPPPQQAPQALVRGSKHLSAPSTLPPAHRGGYGSSSSNRYDSPQQGRPQNLHAPPLMGMNMSRSNSASAMQQNLLMAQQSLLRGAPNMMGSRNPVNNSPNVVMGYNMSGSEQRAPKEMHHSSSNSMTQQLMGNVEPKMNSLGTPVLQEQDRSRQEDNQTPAQRQAAAKLALRKQLEKTLLQIPPPKPPPPEMHFIPNPSNGEFIYLLGLEHVVDYITRDQKIPPPPDPFQCSQCETDFTPVWKWEKSSKSDHKRRQQLSMGHQPTGKELRVICEQCVTTNVKKALKAEHTNRLKTAFVKALQQEQEIEQRMAQGGSDSPQPAPSPKPPTPLPSHHAHAQTPPMPAAQPRQSQAATPPSRDRERERAEAAIAAAAAQFPKFSDPSKFAAALAAAASNPAAALQAAHQQLMRMPQHQPPLPAHMLPFSPLLYPYQLAMAQAAGGKGPVAAAAANLVELQRQAADLQRQYLLDMIPSSSMQQGRGGINWKT